MNLELALILRDVNRLTDSLESIVFKHIYREINSTADAWQRLGVGYQKDFGQLWNIVQMKLWKPFRSSKILIISLGLGGVQIALYPSQFGF